MRVEAGVRGSRWFWRLRARFECANFCEIARPCAWESVAYLRTIAPRPPPRRMLSTARRRSHSAQAAVRVRTQPRTRQVRSATAKVRHRHRIDRKVRPGVRRGRVRVRGKRVWLWLCRPCRLQDCSKPERRRRRRQHPRHAAAAHINTHDTENRDIDRHCLAPRLTP